MALIKDLIRLFLRPKQFASGRTIQTRLWFHLAFRLPFYRQYLLRKRLVDELKPQSEMVPIDEDAGCRKIEDMDPELTNRVVAAARVELKKYDLKQLHSQSANKYLVSIPIKENLNKDNPFLRFALHPPLLKVLGSYFGMLPVIENIMIWYSPNQENFEGSSQLYHLDGQDVRTVQLFVFIEDIDAESGPFTGVEAKESERLATLTNYRKSGYTKRMDDQTVHQNVSPSKIHEFVGPIGSIYLMDTDRCFHYGSRKANKPRFILVFQYFTPFAFSVPFRWWKSLPFAKLRTSDQFSRIEKLVLGGY